MDSNSNTIMENCIFMYKFETSDGEIEYKCKLMDDIDSKTEAFAQFIQIKEVFGALKPGHNAVPNGNCPFCILKIQDKCPYYAPDKHIML